MHLSGSSSFRLAQRRWERRSSQSGRETRPSPGENEIEGIATRMLARPVAVDQPEGREVGDTHSLLLSMGE